MNYMIARYVAIAANTILCMVLLYLLIAEVRSDHLIFCLGFLPPLSALYVLLSKEFFLQKKVRVARLEKELAELSATK